MQVQLHQVVPFIIDVGGWSGGHGQNSSKFVICVVLSVIRVVLLLILMFCVLFMCKCVLPPGVNPIAVDKYTNIPHPVALFPAGTSGSLNRSLVVPQSNSGRFGEQKNSVVE
jgi:hypothetical protein